MTETLGQLSEHPRPGGARHTTPSGSEYSDAPSDLSSASEDYVPGDDEVTTQLPQLALDSMSTEVLPVAGGRADGTTDAQTTRGADRAERDPAEDPTADERGPIDETGGRGRPAGARRSVPPAAPRPLAAALLRSPGVLLQTPRARRIAVVAAVVFGVALLGYLADLAVSAGKVPRGVVVAGVDIGGMDTAEADAELRSALDARVGRELPIRIDETQTALIPAQSGLSVDWDATWDRIGGQPLNPAARLLSLFGTRTVPVASAVDDAVLNAKLEELRVYDEPAVEGGIRFEGVTPIAVAPVPGRVLDLAAARELLIERWATAGTLELPVVPAPMNVRPESIEQALHQIAEPAVSAPVAVTGKGAAATLLPEQIATVIRFVPDGNGGLKAGYDPQLATDLLTPQLVDTEVEPKDATFTLTGGTPSVVPSVTGDKINWPKTLEKLPALFTAAGPQRSAEAVYDRIEPEFTTKAAEDLGITEPMGEFTTSGFTGPSGVNIRLVAQEVNGAVVKPGEVFSLNNHTGPRTAAEGYVESGIINHGRPDKAVGGGISQFATTLYNAAYFAGLEDVAHTEHSYYISRYPAAREATVFDGVIDLQFRNNTPKGIYIQAFADSSQVTVRIWGTKTVEVESITGERTKPTEPQTVRVPAGEDCIASDGAPGFTISDTRVITDIATGREISRTTRTVKYDPVPIVKCGVDEEEEEKKEDRSQATGASHEPPPGRPR
ncbi:VanW family protein [Nocardia paucivorans]|uniref:VanW family protein n=1 Tax=Nocardia paucivorans TaxID=114259 RepID=UPI001FDEC476|nr:VanW family protein [Nocardia paucivorans]